MSERFTDDELREFVVAGVGTIFGSPTVAQLAAEVLAWRSLAADIAELINTVGRTVASAPQDAPGSTSDGAGA